MQWNGRAEPASGDQAKKTADRNDRDGKSGLYRVNPPSFLQ
jgi:hypothetical protein